jgi:hypothetical protein
MKERTNKMKKQNSISIEGLLAFSNNVIADIVTYAKGKTALAALRESIIARLQDEAKNAGVTMAEAAKPLRAALVAEGMDKRRVSEVLLDLGIRERTIAKKNEARKMKSSEFDKQAHALAVQLRKGRKISDAIAIARRAYIILRDSK